MNTPNQHGDGGPAFPRVRSYDDGELVDPGSRGMTIRDYFAARAMDGLLATVIHDPHGRMPLLFWSREHGLGWNNSGMVKDLAVLAYAIADGMLAARTATEGGAS